MPAVHLGAEVDVNLDQTPQELLFLLSRYAQTAVEQRADEIIDQYGVQVRLWHAAADELEAAGNAAAAVYLRQKIGEYEHAIKRWREAGDVISRLLLFFDQSLRNHLGIT